MVTEKLSKFGENLLFPESYTEGLSQKHLMFAHNIKMILTRLYTQFLGKTTSDKIKTVLKITHNGKVITVTVLRIVKCYTAINLVIKCFVHHLFSYITIKHIFFYLAEFISVVTSFHN
jgi:hypothetical protein